MDFIEKCRQKVRAGQDITRGDALRLYEEPLDALCAAADGIRRARCGNGFDLCTIINAKSGRCPENCRFCAQSAHSCTGAAAYPLLGRDEIVRQARADEASGIVRFSIVTAGRRLPDEEVDAMCRAVRAIRSRGRLAVCVSFGLLDRAQYEKLRRAGVTRVHNNLETSRRNFPNICTTHTFDDKLRAIRAAQAAGLEVCSGGIMGLGETPEDRIDMALTLRQLGIRSVPLNLLNLIPGTPLAGLAPLTADDMRRIVAVYRFLLPQAAIRLAGGRGLLPDKGAGCFRSGANAAISGDMLTTSGITVQTDLRLLDELGFEVRYENG